MNQPDVREDMGSEAERRNARDVVSVRLFPGFSASILANMCQAPRLVIEAYAAGNGPSQDLELLAAIEDATTRRVVVIVTPCVRRRCSPVPTRAVGAHPGGSRARVRHDVEAALTELAVLLGQEFDAATVAETMQQDLAGELTH